jgi:hypothetical protein
MDFSRIFRKNILTVKIFLGKIPRKIHKIVGVWFSFVSTPGGDHM